MDDSVIVSLLNNDSPSYDPTVDEFAELFKRSLLDSKVGKTKEMITDFQPSQQLHLCTFMARLLRQFKSTKTWNSY